MRRLLTKLDDYLREHPIAIGHIDANPSLISARSAMAVRSTVLPVPQAPTKIVALLGSPGALSSPSRMSAMSPSRPASLGGTHPKVGVNGLHVDVALSRFISQSFTSFHEFSLRFTGFHFVSQVFTFIAYSTRESFLAFMRVFCQAQDYAQAQNRRAPRQRKGQFAHEILSYKRQRKSVSPAAGHLFRRSWPIPPVA